MKFNFSIDPDGEIDGNDASQEHFSGNRISSVAKELGQNVNDARSDVARKKNEPAVISFKKIKLNSKDIPDLESLKLKLKGSKKFAEEILKNTELVKFYNKALRLASKPSINTLQVTDWNTVGLEGPYDSFSTPVKAFAKGKGISQKSTKESAGSRGIGKNAIFTISGLRTIFFTTCSINRETNKIAYYSQGKSIFISNPHDDGKSILRGTGYCGKDSDPSSAVEGNRIPEWLQRSGHVPDDIDKKGLSLFALGFEHQKNWQFELAASALTTFFSAIQQGLLEFRVNDAELSIVLNKDTYLDYFEDKSIIAGLRKDDVYRLELSKIYAKILIDADNGKSDIFIHEFESGVGKFRLCILVEDNLPSKVAVIRTGMLITNEAPGLKRFAGKPFAATLQAKSKTSMQFIRSLEGAEHDALEPDRLEDQEESKKAHTQLAKITTRVRDLLERYIKEDVDDSEEINELAEFFPYEMDGKDHEDDDGELNPQGKITLTVKKHMPASAVVFPEPEPHPDPDPEPHPDPGLDPDQSSQERKLHVQLLNIRAPLNVNSAKKRTISFISPIKGKYEIDIIIAGGDEDAIINILETSRGNLDNNRIILNDVKPNQETRFEVVFDREFLGALKIIGHKIISGDTTNEV